MQKCMEILFFRIQVFCISCFGNFPIVKMKNQTGKSFFQKNLELNLKLILLQLRKADKLF